MNMNCLTIERELEKNPELSTVDVEKILAWIKTQKHLPMLKEYEAALFLHSNYYNIEETKTTIENYFTSRTHYKELFTNFDLQSEPLQNAHKIMNFFTFPKRTPTGQTVVLCRLRTTDTSSFCFAQCLKLFLMVMEVNLLEEGTSDGLVICFDMSEVHWGHFIKLGPFTVKHFMFYLQEGLPQRIKGLHFFNNGSIIDKILALVKPFMKQSLYDILILHPTIETVFPHVPAELFPCDYPGGAEKSLEEIHDDYFNHLLTKQDYFLKEETRRVNEAFRLVKRRSFWSVFGSG